MILDSTPAAACCFVKEENKMIVSYSNGTDFLQANQALLQENPYLSTFFTLDAPLLKQADTITTRSAASRGRSACWP